MNLQLDNTETKTIKRALIHWSIKLQNTVKNIQLKEIWDIFGNELDTTEKILKKIQENEKSN